MDLGQLKSLAVYLEYLPDNCTVILDFPKVDVLTPNYPSGENAYHWKFVWIDGPRGWTKE